MSKWNLKIRSVSNAYILGVPYEEDLDEEDKKATCHECESELNETVYEFEKRGLFDDHRNTLSECKAIRNLFLRIEEELGFLPSIENDSHIIRIEIIDSKTEKPIEDEKL